MGGLPRPTELCVLYCVFGVVLLAVFSFHIGYGVPVILRRWAEENGYEILRKERWWFVRLFSPWVNGHPPNTGIWVIIRDRNDDLKAGWVQIGSYWNPCSDDLEIGWDSRSIDSFEEGERPAAGSPLLWDRELDA